MLVKEAHPSGADESARIGVAISGGGHRAALWGLGALLYLVDGGLHRHVRTISSVSGGSITNGVVGQRLNFLADSTDPRTFRDAVQPLLTHITTDGLFFYGSATNAYVITALALAAAVVAGWLVVVGIMLVQVARLVLDAVDVCLCAPLGTLPLWVIGLAMAVVYASLAIFAARYARRWNGLVGAVSAVGVGAGLAAIAARVAGARLVLDLDVGFPLLVGVALALTVGLLYWFGRRTLVAERAMDRVHFHGAELDELARSSEPDATQHVFCATELQSGLHAYFSGRFVYSYAYGLSVRTQAVALAKAVQSSAALPGAFGPQRLALGGLDFVDPERGGTTSRKTPMVLLDGGVYDNMAEQWFVGLADRKKRWTAQDSEYGDLLEEVDQLIVVNASAGWRWRDLGGPMGRLSRLAREVAALGRSQAILYNTVGRRRRAHLFDSWTAAPGGGTFVEVDQNPLSRIPDEPQFDDLRSRLDALGLTDAEWDRVVNRTSGYPTVLRWVNPADARSIVWHAYINTAVAAAVHLGHPVPADLPLPRLQDFAHEDQINGLRLAAPPAHAAELGVTTEGRTYERPAATP